MNDKEQFSSSVISCHLFGGHVTIPKGKRILMSFMVVFLG